MTDDIDDLVAAHKAEVLHPPTHVVQQWHHALDEAAALERGREAAPLSRWHPGSFFWGMAISAALAIGIGLVISGPGGSDVVIDEPRIAANPIQTNVVPAAFTRSLQVHLRDSQMQLASLNGDTNKANAFDIDADTARPENTLQDYELASELAGALAQLSDVERVCFVLKHLEQWRHQEIGAELDLNEGRVKQSVFRAVKKLRVSMKHMQEDENDR